MGKLVLLLCLLQPLLHEDPLFVDLVELVNSVQDVAQVVERADDHEGVLELGRGGELDVVGRYGPALQVSVLRERMDVSGLKSLSPAVTISMPLSGLLTRPQALRHLGLGSSATLEAVHSRQYRD